MKKTCRFRTTYNKSTATYSASFKGLSKSHLQLLRSLFSSLECCGRVDEYYKGISMPYMQYSFLLPLSSSPLLDDISNNFTHNHG